jgi:glycosyltransferase involved in cell wall biosynthesis
MAYAPRLEPLGLAPLEAGACGLPVVAVAEAGVRETVVDGITGSLTGPTVRRVRLPRCAGCWRTPPNELPWEVEQ